MKAMDAILRALHAPFGLPAEGALGSGKSRLPSKVNAISRNCHQEDYLTAEQPDVAAVIEEVQLKCFNAKTETSSAADPATDFRPFANSPRSLANNFRIDTRRALKAVVIPELLGYFATRQRLRSYNLGQRIIRLNGFH